MREFDRHQGAWAGTNAFRLAPADPPQHAPISASISRAAGGHITQIAYSWAHPEDGAQDGLLVLGPGAEPSTVEAFWADSWHQSPQPRTLEGSTEGGVITVGYDYSGEWRWEIVVELSAEDQVVLTMNNVVPESAATAEISAGLYAAMRAVLTR